MEGCIITDIEYVRVVCGGQGSLRSSPGTFAAAIKVAASHNRLDFSYFPSFLLNLIIDWFQLVM